MKLTIITACGVSLALAGCSSAHSGQAAGQPRDECGIYSHAENTKVTVRSADRGACDTLIEDLAVGGAVWHYATAAPLAAGPRAITCDMFKGQYEAVVQSGGEQQGGADACQLLISQGWTGQQQLGPLAERLEKQQQATVKVQASQQAAQNLQQRLTGDISKLTRDAAALRNDRSLAAETQMMQGEVTSEQGDYARVRHDSCTTRAGDADSVQGDSSIINGEAYRVQGDINSLRANPVNGDLSAIAKVVSELRNLGASPATNPSPAVAAAKSTLADLDSTIAQAQQQASAFTGTAAQLAQEAATLAAQCP